MAKQLFTPLPDALRYLQPFVNSLAKLPREALNEDIDASRLESALREVGIETGIHYPVPCHLQPGWKIRYPERSLPAAEKFASSCLSLPLSAAVTEEDAQYVVEQLRKILAS